MVERTLKLYRIYCYVNLIWYGVTSLGSITLVLFLRQTTLDLSALPPEQLTLLNGLLVFLAAVCWIFFALTLGVMKPSRTKKWWLGGFLNICLGISTCCLAPLCIPLAIMWSNPDFKRYFEPASFDLNQTS